LRFAERRHRRAGVFPHAAKAASILRMVLLQMVLRVFFADHARPAAAAFSLGCSQAVGLQGCGMSGGRGPSSSIRAISPQAEAPAQE